MQIQKVRVYLHGYNTMKNSFVGNVKDVNSPIVLMEINCLCRENYFIENLIFSFFILMFSRNKIIYIFFFLIRIILIFLNDQIVKFFSTLKSRVDTRIKRMFLLSKSPVFKNPKTRRSAGTFPTRRRSPGHISRTDH